MNKQVSFIEAFSVWLKIGCLSFGGPAAQIALMHRIIVNEKRWLDEKQYLNALSFCMLLPGPEAMQMATYAGWRLHGVRGGLIAGLLFVMPGAFLVLTLAALYAAVGNVDIVNTLFLGIKSAVIVIVIEALLRVSRRALGDPVQWLVAALSFIGIFFLDLSFPLIVVAAGLFGFWRAQETSDVTSDELVSLNASMSLLTVRTVLFWLLIWVAPFVLLGIVGNQAFLIEVGAFFSRLAVVTFGGAYAVLAYLAQDVVTGFAWLSAGEMVDALGLAETTPGPLILVTEFVAYLAGFRQGGVALGLLAAGMTLWVTFVPCYLWIFAGAPYIDWIGAQPRLRGALSAITAAVVGVILNLSVWFALHVWFGSVVVKSLGIFKLWVPDWTSIDYRVVLLTGLCSIALFIFHWGIIRVLITSALLGYVLTAWL